jgi:flavin-dependent dehydrogenase
MAGHIAALQASRTGVKTSVIEAGTMLSGTMTAGGIAMPDYFFSTAGPVVLGIGWELYIKSKEVEGLQIPDYRQRRSVETPGHYSYINVPIYVAIAEEEAVKAGATLHYHEFIANVKAVGDYWEITSLGRGIKRVTKAKEIIDCTGDSDVVRILGLGVLFADVRQPGTYEYKIEGIEYEQLFRGEVQTLYEEAIENGTLKKAIMLIPEKGSS